MKLIEVVIEESVTHKTVMEVPDDFHFENTDTQDKYILDNVELTLLDWDGNSTLEVVTWVELGTTEDEEGLYMCECKNDWCSLPIPDPEYLELRKSLAIGRSSSYFIVIKDHEVKRPYRDIILGETAHLYLVAHVEDLYADL